MKKEKYVYVVQDKSKLLLLNHVTSAVSQSDSEKFSRYYCLCVDHFSWYKVIYAHSLAKQI